LILAKIRAQGHAHRNAEVISNWLALMKPRLVFYGAVLVDGTVRPGDEISLMAKVAGLFLGVALAAAFLPARRAVSVDPMEAFAVNRHSAHTAWATATTRNPRQPPAEHWWPSASELRALESIFSSVPPLFFREGHSHR